MPLFFWVSIDVLPLKHGVDDSWNFINFHTFSCLLDIVNITKKVENFQQVSGEAK
jgi:hypothetical protein